MPKPKYFFDNDPWMLAEHFPNVDFFFSQIWLSSFANNLKKSCGKNYKKVLAVFQPKFYIHFYYGEQDSLDFEQHLLKLVKENTRFGYLINKNIVKRSDKLRKFCARLSKLDLKKFENKEIWGLLEEQDNMHTDLYEWGWLANATDMFHTSFTNELTDYLSKKLDKNGRIAELNKIFNILTSPRQKSVAAEEEENLLNIASVIKKKRNKKYIKGLIDEHYKKYFYLKYLWIGKSGVYSKKYYIEQANNLAKAKISPEAKIREMDRELDKIKKQKQKYARELRIEKKYRDLFFIYGEFMLTKIYRRYAQIYWAYEISKLLEEAGRRMGLALDEIRYVLPAEIKQGLLENKLDRKEIKKRLSFLLYYIEEGVDIISTDSKHQLLKQLRPKTNRKVKELKGQIGCLGKAKGIVKIVNSPEDFGKMKQGDILVSIATNPDLVSAMKKAAAIVTEQGGVTSHAAIVSRELKIPCIIGTKIATQVLKDGDEVEVDADNGVVRIIKN